MAVEKSEVTRAASGEAPPSFEESLERLETIVEELESGSLTLEESIARYEEGVRLSRRLTQRLEEAEKTIERLVANDDPEPATEPMDLGTEDRENPGSSSAPSRGAPTRAPRTTTPPRPRSTREPDELPF